MASASRARPSDSKAGSLPEDLRKLQAEILTGLDSDEDDTADDQAEARLDDSGVVELTETVILKASGEDTIEDVTQLVLRESGLTNLATPRSIDFDRLVNLEVLSLSHNMIEDIEPLSMLVCLVELNLNFNRITDLSPIWDCELLEKLFVSHNLVQSLDGLSDGCLKLQELALFSNRLEDHKELLQTLSELPDLRELYIGENGCCAAPSQRYCLIRDLPSLEVLDGQKLRASDRKFAAAFLDAASKDEEPDSLETQVTTNVPRPVTAPSVCARPRPPLPPSHNTTSASATLAPLPGMKLRSSTANRIDDLLTQSREASPEVVESRIPAFDPQSMDLSDPARARTSLTAHQTALQQCLDTVHMERENLRFQVRLLEEDDLAQQSEQLCADVERLEVENRSSRAVQSEHEQLMARLAEVEIKLSSTSQIWPLADLYPQAAAEDEDVISQLRWENQLLEKRLERMKKYSEQSRHNVLSAQVRTRQLSSSQGPACAKKADKKAEDDAIDPELSSLLSDNEAMLRKLHGDVSKTVAGKPVQSSVHAGLAHHVQCAQVDVLTLASDDTGDVEYHGSA